MTTIPLTFQTTRARTAQGWQNFYQHRDRFLHEQWRRAKRSDGLRFATYAAADGQSVPCYLDPSDLAQHALVLGATGCGKSSLLEQLARFHFARRQGLALIDLHGDLFERTAAWALKANVPNLVLLDFTKPDFLPGWNPLKSIPNVDPGRHVDLLVGVLRRLYASEQAASWAWGVKVEEIVRHTLRALIESKGLATLVELKSSS